MREIKFRAWVKKSHMINLALASLMFDDEDAKLVFGENFHDDFCDSSTKDFELLQFTGLADKNGKDIYEGDIVQAYPYGWQQPGQRVAIYTVVFSEFEGTWALKDERSIEDCPALYSGGSKSRRDETLEVVGNIYEHPDLLK